MKTVNAAAAVLVCCVLLPIPALAQSSASDTVAPAGGWTWGATGMLAVWTKGGDPFERLGGPGAHLGWVWPRNVGFDLKLGYLVPTGFYSMTGLWGQATFTYSIPAGRHLVQLKGGGGTFVGGDSDGSVFAAGGPLAGTGVLLNVTGRLGLQIDGFSQVLFQSGNWVVVPGVAVSLVLLPGRR